MNISQKIDQQLQAIPEGTVFKYQNLEIAPNEYMAASKKIERLLDKGILKRVSKGMFYKPRPSVFGALRPAEEELLKQYLFKNGQRVAYITGVGLYNAMGLTTQIPVIIEIASNTRRAPIKVGHLSIRPAKSYAAITNDNYELLGILDAIRDFKVIPDMDNQLVINLLSNKLQAIGLQKRQELIGYALNYPPKVKALLGAILSAWEDDLELTRLKSSLNPFTTYKYDIQENILPNASKWNIK